MAAEVKRRLEGMTYSGLPVDLVLLRDSDASTFIDVVQFTAFYKTAYGPS